MVNVECMRDILRYMDEFLNGYAFQGNVWRDVNQAVGGASNKMHLFLFKKVS